MRFSSWIKTVFVAFSLVLVPTGAALPAGAAPYAAVPDTVPAAVPAAVPATTVPGTGGAIGAKYASLGGAKGPLGVATSPGRCGLVHGGCFQTFKGGAIYWSPATGAHTMTGSIRGRWAVIGSEHGFLAYPTSDARCGLVSGGCYQSFQNGKIYFQPSVGSWPVNGAIGSKWSSMGYEQSPLSYPASGESCSGTTTRICTQRYIGGSITWNSAHGVSAAPNPGTIAVVVNKRRPNVPINRIPPDLVQVGSQLMRREAAGQMARMITAAASAGVRITTVSGYRSYSTQYSLYYSYVAAYGQAYADTISARPGYSEHQTGLAMDIGNPNGACGLLPCFASTPAGAYAAANAWKYGYIVRYTNGYTSITGYSYEPWHLRYVGVKISADMHNGGYHTLEQYFGMAAAPSY
jgi:zinc D-Ala-D-Ala carboxypeptidase